MRATERWIVSRLRRLCRTLGLPCDVDSPGTPYAIGLEQTGNGRTHYQLFQNGRGRHDLTPVYTPAEMDACLTGLLIVADRAYLDPRRRR